MKKLHAITITCLLTIAGHSQVYNKEKVCGTDTIHVNYMDRRMDQRVQYDGFACTQAGKAGLRVDFGYISFNYTDKTKKWLAHPIGGTFNIAFAYDKFNLGVKLKMPSSHPLSELVFGGDTLSKEYLLNTVKIDYYIGYSLDLQHNFSFEPYIGLTRNTFYAVDTKKNNKRFDIPTVHGLNAGITFTKYFRLKEFKFMGIFLSYGYGFSNFKKVNSSLGNGYSEWSAGLTYKVFTKRFFHDKIN